MATFALIHGGGSTAWDWHVVSPLLTQAGHEVVAVDLPIEDPAADLDDYVRTVTDAVGDRTHVIVVGHSLGGFTAPLVADALHAEGLVFFTAMIPRPLPAVPTMGIVCTDDQFFPAPFMRRLIDERLGIEPVEIPGGHYAALTHPVELAVALDRFAREIGSTR